MSSVSERALITHTDSTQLLYNNPITPANPFSLSHEPQIHCARFAPQNVTRK
jgi:hypothetical protein